MSEPKPPFGFKTFIDYKMEIITTREWDRAARAELAQLRAQAAAYQNVMHELCRLPELNMSNYDSDQVAKLNTGVNNLVIAEIAANRFAP